MTAVDSRGHRMHAFPETDSYISTASAPSLRARGPVQAEMMDRLASNEENGNVKVVVRVRKFIKRGHEIVKCA